MTDKKTQNQTDNKTASQETAVTIEETKSAGSTNAETAEKRADTAGVPEETHASAAAGTIVEKTADTELQTASEASAPEQSEELVVSFEEEAKPRKWRRNKAKKAEKPLSERKWVQIRMFPIWLRVLFIIILMASAAALGAVVGFSVIGDGTAAEVFKKETWQHIFDIMNGK